MTQATAPKKPVSSLRRFIKRLPRVIVTVYLVMCCLAYLAQDWMAFPGAAEQGKPETKITFGGDAEVVHFTTGNNIPITAVFGIARKPDGTNYTPADHRPTVLYFYGNGGCASFSQSEFNHFRQAGCNVLIPDVPGYGESGGKPSEANFYAAADAAWNYLLNRPGVDQKKIVVVGWSMGSGVAVDLASRKPVAGLATMNAYTSLTEMGRKLLPWLPTSLLLKYRFDNLEKMPDIHCPVFICNGKLDTLVPPEMSDRLAAKSGGKVTRLMVPTADHNTIFVAEPELIWGTPDHPGELTKWLDGLSK